MLSRKNRKTFYAIIAMTVAAASLVGGWLINSAINRPQHDETEARQDHPEVTLIDEYFKSGLSHMQNKNYPQAVLAWNQLLLLNDSIPEVHVNQGFSLFEMGHIEPASRHFERALELNNYQVNAYYGLAICYEKMEDMEAAMGAMRSFIHLAEESDPFIRKARSALWEWESREKPASTTTDTEVNQSMKSASTQEKEHASE